MDPLLELLARDLEGFPSAAARHGLSGYALHLADKESLALPADAQRQLRQDARMIAGQSLRVKSVLFRALDALAKVGVIPVLLKGYGVGLRLYPDPLMRATSDADLLVAPRDLETASQALTRLGLSRLPEETEEWHRSFHHHINFSGPGALVELHFRASSGFGSTIEADDLVTRSSVAELDGRKVRFLEPHDEMAYLATHAAGHLLQRVGWLVDLKLLANAHPELDWALVAKRARESGMAVPVFLSLSVARDVLALPVPGEVLDSLAPGMLRRMVAKRLFTPERLLKSPFLERHRYWRLAAITLFSSTGENAAFFFRHAAARGLKRKAAALAPRWVPHAGVRDRRAPPTSIAAARRLG